jgi:hypothetical protein
MCRCHLPLCIDLFDDDHSDAMAALGAMANSKSSATNVVPLRR